jgi:uroporphyrinogen-III decarboxylase
MKPETMTPRERIACALSLEKPDRVPVVPQVEAAFCHEYGGVTHGQGFKNKESSLECFLKVFDDFGGWDAVHYAVPHMVELYYLNALTPVKHLIPGVNAPEDKAVQTFEEEVMKFEEYGLLMEMGWIDFYFDVIVPRCYPWTREEALTRVDGMYDFVVQRFLPALEERNIRMFFGSEILCPFDFLSEARSFVKFTEDIHYHPDTVEKALAAMNAAMIGRIFDDIKKTGIDVVDIDESRASAFFYPPHVFERFRWPFLVETVETLWSAGILSSFHADSDWLKNLPYFRRDLPKGSYNMQLDGTTDIVEAKKILRGHGSIYGDIPAQLMAYESPEQVEAYVKMLIDEVGHDGGLIVSNGCTMPPNAKPENFRAMLETAKTYELSRG